MLHMAISKVRLCPRHGESFLRVLDKLVEHGLELNLQDDLGRSVLHVLMERVYWHDRVSFVQVLD